MATLTMTEFSGQASDPRTGQSAPMAPLPPLAQQSLAVAAAMSAVSNAFSTDTRTVRFWSDVDCRVVVGKNPTAAGILVPLAAKVPEYFGVQPGDKAAVIAA